MREFRIRTCSQGGWPPGRAPGQLRPRCRPLHQTARAHRPCWVHTHSTTGSRLNSLQWSLHILTAVHAPPAAVVAAVVRGCGLTPLAVPSRWSWWLEPGRPLRIRCPAATRPRRPADRPQAVTQPAGLRPRLSPLPEPVLRVGQVRRSQRQADTTHTARSPPGLRRAGPGRRSPDSHEARQSADLHAARQAGHLDRRTGAEPGQEPLSGVHTGRPGSPGLPRPGVQAHTAGHSTSCSCSPTAVGDGGRRRRADGYDSPSDIQAHAARSGSPAARVSRVVTGCNADRPLVFWYFSNASGSSAPKARRPLMALPTPCRAVGLVGGGGILRLYRRAPGAKRLHPITQSVAPQSRKALHPITQSVAPGHKLWGLGWVVVGGQKRAARQARHSGPCRPIRQLVAGWPLASSASRAAGCCPAERHSARGGREAHLEGGSVLVCLSFEGG